MASMVVNKAKGDVKFESRVKVMVEFHHGDLRRRDSDNGLSSILDLLVDCHVLHDDCWKIVRMLEVTNEYDQKNPHCVVTVEEL